MRFAIFSDVHANLEALDAVLTDARDNKCTHFVCLGDVVGYNANPHECVDRIREMDCPIVKGNHDEQASLVESSRDFNEMAEAAILWTRDHLSGFARRCEASGTCCKVEQDFRTEMIIQRGKNDHPGYSFERAHWALVTGVVPLNLWFSDRLYSVNISHKRI